MSTGLNTLTLQERVLATLAMSESHFREFKSAWEGAPGRKQPRDVKAIRRDIGETLVAFANADGGELLVGVEDDGTITGVPHSQSHRASLVDAWKTHVHARTPLDRPLAVELQLEGSSVLYFAVDKGTSVVHLTQDGRCLQRKDRESIPVATEMIHFERQERLSREYDRGFVDGADATVLDEGVLSAVGQQVAPGLSPEKVLQLLGLAEFSGAGLRLRRAAVLLFARDVTPWHPRCEVRLLRVEGTELMAGRDYNVVADKHVVGNILDLLQTAWDDLRPYLVETRLGPDGRFQEQVRYPEDACREALTNAIAHRDYTIEGRAIEVYVFDDRLEVRSPGALLTTVTVEGLRSLEGIHQSRNTAIARVLRELGYMREMGEGFRRMFQLMRAHDLVEPEVITDGQQFSVSLRHRSVFSEEDQRWIAAFDEFNLARDEEKVLLLGRQGKTLSVQQIMDAVDIVDTEDYRALIERLQSKGLIRGLKARSTGKQRRNSPRWSIVQPREATVYLGELVASVATVSSGRSLNGSDYERILETLEASSPYRRTGGNVKKSLVTLGLIDNSGAPRATLTALARVAVRPATLVASPATAPALEAGASTDELEQVEEIARDRGTRLYIGNLAFDAQVADLRDAAEQIGATTNVAVPPAFGRRSGNRGFGFVEFADVETAKRALVELAGVSVAGRPILVDWASSGPSRRAFNEH